MDDDEHEEQTMIDYDESLTIVELVNQGWDWFWGQNELTYDKHLNIVRSETPRVRPFLPSLSVYCLFVSY